MNISLCTPLDLRIKYILLITLFISCAKSNSDSSQTNLGKNITQSSSSTTSNNNGTKAEHILPNSNAIATEGGNVSNEPPKSDTTHRGREGVHFTAALPTIPNQPSNSSNATVSVSNSGPKSVISNMTMHDITSNQAQFEVAGKVEGKNSVRKNLPLHQEPVDIVTKPNNVTNSTEMRNVTNQVKEKPKKPLFTESSYDEVKKADESKHRNNVPSMDMVEEQKSHRSADYVVPIVAVILSVPLVAIIISVLYKRASEWWHHRHYRRMDFLIEGMYNN